MEGRQPNGSATGDAGHEPLDWLVVRARTAAWLLIFTLLAFAVVELVVRPGENPAVSATHILGLGLLIALTVPLYRNVARRTLVAVALAGVMTTAAVSAAVAALTGDANTSSFIFVALAMGSAALLPWGARPQALIALGLAFLFPIVIYVAEGGFTPFRLREYLGLVVILGTSVYIAGELERNRRRASAEIQRRLDHEREIQRQRHFLRAVIDMNPHLIFAKDREGRFTLVNRAVAEIYGTTVKDLIGKTDADFNPNPEEAAFCRKIDLEVLASGEERVIPEERITDAKGRVRWLRTIKRPLLSADGKVEQVLGVAMDITEQRTFQMELQEEVLVASTLSHAAEEIIAALSSPQLPEALCRVATWALTGLWAQLWAVDETSERIIPAAQHLAPPEMWQAIQVVEIDRSMVAELWRRAEAREIVFLTPDNVTQWVPQGLLKLAKGFSGAVVIPLWRGTQLSGALAVGLPAQSPDLAPALQRIAQGLSQLASLTLENARLLQEVERASRLKSEFMATMSHELRTPLNVILGYSGLLLEGALGNLTDEQLESVSRLRLNALQLLDLVNATLDVTRLEAGKVPLDLRPTSVAEVVAQTVRETVEQLRPQGLDIWRAVPPTLPPVTTDAIKLKVILKNLLANALKFTPSGWVLVDGHLEPGHLVLRVSDTGIGIPPAQQDVIFEPFQQVAAPLDERHRGVGLGLYIVRRLVDAFGGNISVSSEPGRGTQFTVQLPVDPKTSASA
ncbi:Autoinducer 2 sensor kinase/phosphatase LuxQ [bacterium HR30]|nr:Autoinducer 2 sensor kinase/phosphatase LuxQ [bacterium HR30]